MRRLLILLCCFVQSVGASMTMFEPTVLFVKLQAPDLALSHPLITNQRHLFNQIYEVTTPDAVLLEKSLQDNSAVEWVEKSFIAPAVEPEELETKTNKAATSAAFGLSDKLASELWAFRSASRNGISFKEAYEAMPSWEAKPVVVAVLDSGVDYRHPDLKDVMWINEKEIPGNGIDDDNNGYVDDVYGIDLVKRDSDPAPTHFHGTHVAGTIAATQNNNIGVAGVASHARIMAIRTVPDYKNETDSSVVASLLYAAKNGAKVINCSFGKTRQGKVVEETIAYVGKDFGALVVAAAGNDSRGKYDDWHNIDKRGHYPSSFENETMLVVTATTEHGDLADFSNVGAKSVDVAAPGDFIYSTIMRGRYGTSSGTSMATPIVSGIAAQLLSYYPSLTPLELKEIIMSSVTREESLRGKVLTSGRVDLARAMEYASQRYSHRN